MKKYFVVFEIHTFQEDAEINIARLNYEVTRNFIQGIEDIRDIERELLEKINTESPLEKENMSRLVTVIDWKRFD